MLFRSTDHEQPKFDISGRVFKNVPAPTNLPVPPYQFVTDNRILIGAEKGNA